MPSTSCSPAFSTPRTSRPTDGAVAARFAALLGRPFIPWQRAWADVVGERDPATGHRVYRRVVMVLPRRAGKSVLTLAESLSAGATTRHHRGFYASHRRETAAALWRDDWMPWLEDSPLRRHCSVYRGNGSERFFWHRSRSTFRLLPPDADVMRSLRADHAVIDEAREFTVDQGDAIEAALFPTQATSPDAQTWIVSSAGEAHSLWLRRWVDIGREAAREGRTERIAYLEYAAPDDADPTDEATWFMAHPALGHHVQLEALRADAESMSADTFACEYLGRWPETLVDTVLIDAWARCVDKAAAPLSGVVFAVEVDEDREYASIVVAGAGVDGRPVLELIAHDTHGPWVKGRLAELVEAHQPVAVTWDAGGPAAALTHDLAELPTALAPLHTPDVAAASGWLYDAALAGAIAQRPDPLFDAAVLAGRRRRAGGSWVFDRRQPGVGPLIGAALAAWCHRDASRRVPNVA